MRLAATTLAAAAALSFSAAAPAFAQKPVGKDKVPIILVWSEKEQLERYPAIEKVYQVGTIRKGDSVRALPVADKQIDPSIKVGKASFKIDRFMKDNRISGVIAVKDGKIVLEKYALGRKPTDRWTTFSVAKSVTSILMGAAVKDGYVRSIYDPVTRYLPELKGSAYDDVSLAQLMSMTSGAKWNENYTDPKSDVSQAGTAPFKGGPAIENDPLLLYMKGLKREAEPGAKWVYKTGETDLAGLALVRALGGKSLSDYASEKLWKPFGMESDAIWIQDLAGLERGGCCISATLRDYARIGLFMLGGGEIDGRQVLPDGYVEAATTNQLSKSARKGGANYGYFWWPSADGKAYAAYGIFGQTIQIYPEENLIIVINAAMSKASDKAQSLKEQALITAVRTAANAG